MAMPVTTTTSTPFAKFANHGDKLVAAFAGGKSRQQQNFDTKAPIFKPDGRPALEEVMWFIVLPGTTAVTGDVQGGRPDPLNPGDRARFAVAGFKWGATIDQRKQLPAYGAIKAGQAASGDIYEIVLSGWSAETKNPAAAQAAGFTVVEGRIILRNQQEKDNYVLAQSRNGGNTNPAKDYTITIRRPTPAEADWEAQADAFFAEKPWEGAAADHAEPVTVGGQTYNPAVDEPF